MIENANKDGEISTEEDGVSSGTECKSGWVFHLYQIGSGNAAGPGTGNNGIWTLACICQEK